MDLVALVSFIMIVSLVVPFMDSLLSLGLVLLVSAFCCTLVLSYVLGSWFGFILFLIYITGLLVLFGYMLAMSPNNFYTSLSKVKMVFVAFVLLMAAVYYMAPVMVLTPLIGTSHYLVGVVSMYTNGGLILYWFLGLVLFVALVMAVTLCYKSPKPLRSFLK